MNATLSARIARHLAAGATLPAAFDAVLGAGTYDAMVSELYAALRQEG